MMALRQARTGGLLALALVIAAIPLVAPNNFWLGLAILIGLNGIVAVGLNLLIGYAGQISLGHAGFFGLGAYASAVLSARFGWPTLLALLAGLAASGLLAFALARPVLRLKGHYLAMATLGLGIIVSIVLNQETALTGGPDGMPVPTLSLFGLRISGERAWYWVTGAVLLVTVWLALNLIDSPIGRSLRALHGSEVAAASLGVDIDRAKTLVFVVSAVLAALAGSMTAHYADFITPSEAGFLRSVEFVTMVVLGGMASTFGALLGAAVLTALPQLLTTFHDYEQVVLGAILMAVMVFMPQGVLPTLARRFR
jgi:branched-chain amino acid transport system permease protein